MNILLITLDCVRPDHLGCYGYGGVETPTLDNIAAEGAIFTQAICQCPVTWVSLASIFTGCNPYRHGLRGKFDKISSQVTTLAEVIKAHGWRTGGFPAHDLLSRHRGFARGFDWYDDSRAEVDSNTLKGVRYYKTGSRLLDGFREFLLKEDAPFMAWLHYMGTHSLPLETLNLPQEYRERFSPRGQYYDGKISYCDAEFLQPIVSLLKDIGRYEDTLFAIFSDHGEELENNPPYRNKGHGRVPIEATIKIALILRAPGVVAAGKRVDSLVSSVDLLPTILEAVEIQPPPDIDGKSLLSLCAGERDERIAYVEHLRERLKIVGLRTETWKLLLRQRESTQKQRSLAARVKTMLFKMCGRHTTVRVPWEPVRIQQDILDHGEIYGLYDLTNDPDDKFDVSAQHPEHVSEMQTRLISLLTKTSTAPSEELTGAERAELENRLRQLGYLD